MYHQFFVRKNTCQNNVVLTCLPVKVGQGSPHFTLTAYDNLGLLQIQWRRCGAELCKDDQRSEPAPLAQENVQIANCGSIDAGKLAYRRVAGFFTKRYTKRSRHTGTTIVPAVSATAIRCGSMSSRPWAWVSEPQLFGPYLQVFTVALHRVKT